MSDIDKRIEVTKALTIMMVDDEPTTLDVLEMLLRDEGYRKFVTTTDSRRVLDLLAEERPDILLLNLVMPNVGGLEILGSLRADQTLPAIPVIILTSSTDAEAKRRARELGAADFLAKPVDPSELALRLQNTVLAEVNRDGLASQRIEQSPWASNHILGQSGPPVASRLDRKSPRFRAIIEKFVARLHVRLEAMEASWEAGDLEELASLAHWLKGAAGTVGFDAFTVPAQTLHILARQGKRNAAEASLRELRRLADRIVISNDSGA